VAPSPSADGEGPGIDEVIAEKVSVDPVVVPPNPEPVEAALQRVVVGHGFVAFRRGV